MLDSSGSEDVYINFLNGTASGSEIGIDTLLGIENVITAEGDDTVTGDAAHNHLDVGGGDDTVSAGAGDDTLIGGNGDDELDGGEGLDFVRFSGSFDDYRINAAGDGFLVSDSVEFRDGVDLVTNVEFFVFPGLAVTSAGLNALVAQKDNTDEELVVDLASDVDGDGSFHPLTDGLLITSAAQAIEIAAGTESQPISFNANLHDQLINPNGSRNTTDAANVFIKDAITSGSLDRNNNGVLDLQDAQRILRDGLGTYPGDAATAGLREPPVPAGTTNSDLINEQEQLDALDDSLEAIALMAEAGPQFLGRGLGGSC